MLAAMMVLSLGMIVLAIGIAIPVCVLMVEVLAAALLRNRRHGPAASGAARPRIAVLVPAHNEGAGVIATIEDIKLQLRPGDRLLVIADNCDDNTAAVAEAAGAQVVTRHDPSRRGKGFALDWGIQSLAGDPPEVVIVVDADCRLGEGAIDQLAVTCAAAQRPVQALDLMVAPKDCAIHHRIAEFAWRIKNWVRPLGLSKLRLPCQLVGTGMAFPWPLIASAHLANNRLAEDLKLGLDLARAGHPAMFCPSAVVTSVFPSSDEGAGTQRQRWEHGHLELLVSTLPRLLLSALARCDLRLLVLVLDLAVPPLALLALLTMGAVVVTALGAAIGASATGFFVAAGAAIALAGAILLAWWTHGRDILPARDLLRLALYVLGKRRFYIDILRRGFVSQWIRTDRG